MGSHTCTSNLWEHKHDFYAALPFLPFPSTEFSYASILSPNSVGHGNKKSSTTGAHIFFFPPTLEKREVSRCGWYTIHLGQSTCTNEKGTRKCMGNQKPFNRRGLILYLCVKTLRKITRKKLFVTDYQTQKDLYRNLGISWNVELLLIYILLHITFQVTFIAFCSKCTLSFFYM